MEPVFTGKNEPVPVSTAPGVAMPINEQVKEAIVDVKERDRRNVLQIMNMNRRARRALGAKHGVKIPGIDLSKINKK